MKNLEFLKGFTESHYNYTIPVSTTEKIEKLQLQKFTDFEKMIMLVESIIPEFHNPETEIIPLVNKNISMKSIFKKSKINEINLKK